MHFTELTYELNELMAAYEKKFNKEYPFDCLPFDADETKKDLEMRLKDGGEPVPEDLWRPTYERLFDHKTGKGIIF